MIKTIIHITTSLHNGGAEAALFRLVCNDDSDDRHIVISMREEGVYSSKLSDKGITVHHLDMGSGKITIKGLFLLARLLRQYRPTAIQTWMYHANFVGGIIARLCGARKIFWGIHHATFDPERNKKSTLFVIRLCRYVSRIIPYRIIYCSQKSSELHNESGFCHAKTLIIPNGYELDKFKPLTKHSPAENTITLGMVARFDPLKDHDNLLRALASLKNQKIDFVCRLIGQGMDTENTEMLSLINRYDLAGNVEMLGEQEDIPSIMNQLDIHILSSSAEAFPNVIAEAMACGTPCVATDVGDTATIIGAHGWVVNARDSGALAAATLEAIRMKREAPQQWSERQDHCRAHIVKHFTIERMISNYKGAWGS